MKAIHLVPALAFVTMSVLFSCKNEEKKSDIPIIEISDKAESGVLELSDVMSIDKIVTLETTPDNLIPGFASLIPAGKYLLIIEPGNKRIHQYSREGKFIRFLLTGGGGPNEYRGITAYATDTVNQIFYYSHFGDNKHVSVVNMESGEHQKKIPLPVTRIKREEGMVDVGSALKSLFILRDNTLGCVPYNPAGLYSFFTMDVNGKFLSGIPMDSTDVRFGAQQLGTEIHFYKTYLKTRADTIYRVMETDKFKPVTILNVSLRELKGNETLSWDPLFETPSKFIVRQGIFTVFDNGNRIDNIFHLADKQHGNSVIFSNYRIDFLGGMEFEFNRSSSLGSNGNELAVKIDAVEFREKAQTILKKEDADPNVSARLEKLMSEVTDDSNPIVLIGRLK